MQRLWRKIIGEAKLLGQAALAFVRGFKYQPHDYWADRLQAGSKIVLEFIRNLAVVSAISFFAKRADSRALFLVAQIGIIALSVSVATYFNRIIFTGWDEIENPTLRRALNTIYSMFPALLAYVLLGKFINYAVEEIVRSQMLK